jgi:hypothetical protein
MSQSSSIRFEGVLRRDDPAHPTTPVPRYFSLIGSVLESYRIKDTSVVDLDNGTEVRVTAPPVESFDLSSHTAAVSSSDSSKIILTPLDSGSVVVLHASSAEDARAWVAATKSSLQPLQTKIFESPVHQSHSSPASALPVTYKASPFVASPVTAPDFSKDGHSNTAHIPSQNAYISSQTFPQAPHHLEATGSSDVLVVLRAQLREANIRYESSMQAQKRSMTEISEKHANEKKELLSQIQNLRKRIDELGLDDGERQSRSQADRTARQAAEHEKAVAVEAANSLRLQLETVEAKNAQALQIAQKQRDDALTTLGKMRQTHTDNERKLLTRIHEAEKEKTEALQLCEEMKRRFDETSGRVHLLERSSEAHLASERERISQLEFELQQQQGLSELKMKSLNEERNSIALKLQPLAEENSRLSSELLSKSASVTRLEEQNRELQGQLSVTLNKLHTIMLDEGDAKETMLRMQRERADLAAREHELVSRLSSLDSSRHAEQSIHNELKAIIARLEQELIDVKRDRDSVFSELANSRQTISSLEMMCGTVRSESERVRTSLMEHVEQLDSRVKALVDEREKLLTSERELKRKFEQSNELVMYRHFCFYLGFFALFILSLWLVFALK